MRAGEGSDVITRTFATPGHGAFSGGWRLDARIGLAAHERDAGGGRGRRDRARMPELDVQALKRQLARELCAVVVDMYQCPAAAWLGVTQSDLSLLRAEKLERFSIERLLRLLYRQRFAIAIQLMGEARSPRAEVVRLDRSGRAMRSAPAPRNPRRGAGAFDDLTTDW